ncbi:MAG: sensor histidine kinase [Bdellovibrionia bacterium]
MKIKIICLVTLLSLALMAVVAWKIDQTVYADKLTHLEVQSRGQTQYFEELLLHRLAQVQRTLAPFARASSPADIQWNQVSPFIGVAQVALSQNKVLLTSQFEKTPGVIYSQLSEALSSEILNHAKSLQNREQVIIAVTVLNKVYTGLIMPDKNSTTLFIAEGSFLGGHAKNFPSSDGEVIFLTNQGKVFSKSEAGHVGTSLASHPLFIAARKVSGNLGVLKFDLGGEPTLGTYRYIAKSNLLVLHQTSLKGLVDQRWTLWLQMALIFIGFLIVTIVSVQFLFSHFAKQIQFIEGSLTAFIKGQKPELKDLSPDSELKDVATLVSSLQNFNFPKSSNTAVTEVAPKYQPQDFDKTAAYTKVASSLAHELNSPLASIIGFAQMVLAEKPDAKVEELIQSLLREVRHAKGVIEKLQMFSGEKKTEAEMARIESPVLRALRNLDALILSKGVKLVKKYDSKESLQMNLDSMTLAIENILKNAVEAMERMPKKELEVRVHDEGEQTYITIRDSGEGIETKNLDKVQDPFFTTRSFFNHIGLGLSMAAGVVREHQGRITISSEKGKGTTVTIILPNASSQKVAVKPMSSSANNLEAPLAVPAEENILENNKQQEELKLETKERQLLNVNLDELLEVPAAEDFQEQKTLEAPLVKTQDLETKEYKESVTTNEQSKVEVLSLEAVQTKAEFVFDDDKTPVDFIDKPKPFVFKKKSILDDVTVEVRKPQTADQDAKS